MKRTQRLTAAAVMALAANAAHGATVTNWLSGTGDWYDPAQWTAGVPTSTAAARIVNDGPAQLTGGHAFALGLDVGGFSNNGITGAGTLVHTGGTLTVSDLNVGNDYAGSYQMSGADTRLTVNGQVDIGLSAPGTFAQSGGTHTVTSLFGIGSNGLYQLSGGAFEFSRDLTLATNRGSGTFTQSGGTVTGVGPNAILYVGNGATGSTGTYQLQAGSLDVARQVVAAFNAGTFNQTGGTNTVATALSIRTAAGRYNLTGGTLAVANLDSLGTFNFTPGGTGTLQYSGLIDFSKGTVTNAAQGHLVGGASSLLVLPTGANPATYIGTLTTAGLVHVAGNTLNVPAGRTVDGIGAFADHVNLSDGTLSGALTLSRGLSMSAGSNASLPLLIIQNTTSGMTGGTLASVKHYVGDNSGGTFTQAGGTNTTDLLAIRAGSKYVLSNGSLQTNQGLEAYGTIDFGGGGAGGSLSLNGIGDLATGTMLAPSHVDVTLGPSALLLVPNGFNADSQFKSFTINGGIVHPAGTDLIIPAGTTVTGGGATITDHLTVNGTLNGTYVINTTKGVTVNAGGVANFGSGVLRINDLTSGVNGGTLTTDNATGFGTLSVGQSGPGSFAFDGGTVTTAFTYVGENSAGTLAQTAGFLRASSGLRVGLNAGSAGTYTLSGGTMSIVGSRIGISTAGTGTFNQTGGTHSTSSVTLGTTGTYNLSAGSLTTPSGGTGVVVNGVFNQSGGDIVTPTLTIGGSFSGTGTFNMSGGTITGVPFFPNTPVAAIANVNPGGRFTLSGSGALNAGVVVKGTFLQSGGTLTGGVDLSGSGRFTIGAGSGAVPRLSGVTVADSGKVDVKDNAMVLTGFNAVVGTRFFGNTYNGITGLIQSGYNAGNWNGTKGIITTMPDAAAGLTSIGVATAGQTGYSSTFRGVSVMSSSVLVMYTYAGDANLDGLVSGDDYSAIDFSILVPGSYGWVNGDFNYDGRITGDDYSAIDFSLLAQGAPFPTGGGASGIAGINAVPEPAAAGVFLVTAAALVRLPPRRRR
jgi:hypothetical protein